MKKKKTGSESLDNTLKEIRKKFGPESIMTLRDKPAVGVDALPTGSLGVDIAIGIGGLPKGRIIEIFGPESSGKTTMALTIVSEAQKRGTACAYIDVEHAMDPEYAARLGVDTGKLLISQPDSGEDALQIVEALVRGGDVGVIIVDSVAMLTPRAEIEGEIGEIKVGALARLMSQSMRKLTPLVEKSECVVVFINQIRMTMMTFGGANPETTPGGKALKFAASVRLDMRRIASIKKGDEHVGNKVRVKVAKNKVGPPFRIAELDIIFNEGVSKESELLELGKKWGVVNNYVYGSISLGRGWDTSRIFLKENPDVAVKLCAEICAKINES